jgi:hypothetical protein
MTARPRKIGKRLSSETTQEPGERPAHRKAALAFVVIGCNERRIDRACGFGQASGQSCLRGIGGPHCATSVKDRCGIDNVYFDAFEHGSTFGNCASENGFQLVEAFSRQCGYGNDLGVRNAVIGQQLRKICGNCGTPIVESIDLIENESEHARMCCQRLDVPEVQRSIGILLRVGHPDDDIHELDEPVDLESVLDRRRIVVRQVEQDKTVETAMRHLDLMAL